MSYWKNAGAILASGVLVLISTISFVFAEAFIDQRLEAWKTVSGRSQIASETRSVIVFLKAQPFKDRSQFITHQAVAAEKSEVSRFLISEAGRLLPSHGLLQGAARTEVLWASNALVAPVTQRELDRLARDSNVEAIIENAVIPFEQPMKASGANKTDESKLTYGLQKINAPSAWAEKIDGSGVVVGVIDTGVDADHPDLKGKILLQKDFTADNDNKDYHGHGTHVSGTIVGGDASGRQIGVAPGAKIIMAKVFDSKGSAETARLLKAMEWMMDPDEDPNTNDAPRIVSNSWGASSMFFYGFRNVVRNWRRFNIFPSFAAGNSGFYFTVGAPGAYPFAYAVGAVDENLKVTSFSSRGPVVEFGKYYIPKFHTKPEISAPGLNVYSSVPGGAWEYYSGTSMATPHVSGVIALLLQVSPFLTVEDLEKLMNGSVVAQSKGKSNKYGFGIIQVDQAVARAKSWTTSSMGFHDQNPALWTWDTP